MPDTTPQAPLDALVIGAGPAGLQAGLTLGRMHRHVVVLDSGSYRNETATALHNFATHDGAAPSEYRARARLDLEAYATVELRKGEVTEVRQDGEAFVARLFDGSELAARRLVLATGVHDVLPDVPGIRQLFGTVVAHCPFCHGHEFADGTVVVQGGPHATRVAAMMEPIAGRLVVVTDGHRVDPVEQEPLAARGVELVEAHIAELVPEGEGARVVLDDGTEIAADGFFVRATFEQSAPFAAQLGLATLPSGCVEVDVMGRTSLAGVYAAGDLAHQASLPMPLASVLTAAAAGLVAASTVHHELLVGS